MFPVKMYLSTSVRGGWLINLNLFLLLTLNAGLALNNSSSVSADTITQLPKSVSILSSGA